MQRRLAMQAAEQYVKTRYDDDDLRRLFAWRSDVDALLEAILTCPEPATLEGRPEAQNDWAGFRALAEDIATRRSHE